ncbi:hypothetical protein L202_01779 [Cryptococcus amylolentus CBS 6039]|uniref:Uncharacterized protein n=2 Tax=Cryptococcus amylolentus TaxID=104669 RepID=A0A1E3I4S6_9TREE|nr:hypothetical protein L202_01779 [Cryptococcus amylolentus CBS 6039]ODN83683.1 hypothetical protein L202_01779 [Cryptococcus amylolentus CBS 6039]ODO11158.1 hypothetical protein I350_01761 [Cryptococcus amylolentus CBS 6273]
MSNNNDRSGREDNPNDDGSNAAGSSTAHELYYARHGIIDPTKILPNGRLYIHLSQTEKVAT